MDPRTPPTRGTGNTAVDGLRTSVLGGDRKTREVGVEIKNLLRIPECAAHIAVPPDFSTQVHALFLDVTKDTQVLQRTHTARQLQAIGEELARPPVCYYPFGGADAYYAALLTGASVTLMTGSENWGCLHDISTAFQMDKMNWAVDGAGVGGFDSIVSWAKSKDDLNFNQYTMGPFAISRAAIAQTLNGETIKDIHVCAFELQEGQVNFTAAKPGQENNENIAFWLTASDNQKKLYLYKKIFLSGKVANSKALSAPPSQQSNSDVATVNNDIQSIHALLSKISGPRQTLMLQKAIPPDMFNRLGAESLLTPPAALVKAVICDLQIDSRHESQPVFIRGEGGRPLQQQTIELTRVDVSEETRALPVFGYGRKVFIHRPVVEAGISAY